MPAVLLAQTTQPQLSKTTVKQVVAAMTVEQKAKLVTGMGMVMPGPTANNDKKDKKTKRNAAFSPRAFWYIMR